MWIDEADYSPAGMEITCVGLRDKYVIYILAKMCLINEDGSYAHEDIIRATVSLPLGSPG